MFMAQVVSFIIQKGGCGKTTTTVNTGGYLSMQGFRVLCIDMDPQGNMTQHFGYDNEILNLTVLDLFQKNAQFDEVVLKRSENLHVLPNNLNSAAAELPLYKSFSREFLLRDAIHSVLNDYDFILIDCPPTLGVFSINALAASTEFVMVIAPEFFPMKSIKPLYNTYRMVKEKLNHTLRFSGVAMTMCDFRTRHSQEVYGILKKNFPHKLYNAYIRNNVTLKEASSCGNTIFEYAPRSIGAFDYQNFTEEFILDHHKNIEKRNYYQKRFNSLNQKEREQINVFAQRNLSNYNRNMFDKIPDSTILKEAFIVERNRLIEKLFPYSRHVTADKIE